MTKPKQIVFRIFALLLIPVLTLTVSAAAVARASDDMGTTCPDCGGTGTVVINHKHNNNCDGYVRIEGGTYTPELLTKSADATTVFKFNKAQNGDRLVIEQYYYLTNSSEKSSIPAFRSSCDFLMKSGKNYASSNSKSGVTHSAVYWTQSEAYVHSDIACYIRSGEYDPTWSKLSRFVEICRSYDMEYVDIAGWCRDVGGTLNLISSRSDHFSVHAPSGHAGKDEQFYTYSSAELTHVEDIDGFRNWCFFSTSSGYRTSTSVGSVTYRLGKWSVWRPAYLCGYEEGENVCVCETCAGTGYIVGEQHSGELPEIMELPDSHNVVRSFKGEPDTDQSSGSDSECLIEADIGSSFVVTIPKRIVLDSDGCATYTVSMLGDIKGSEYVRVRPKLTDGGILLTESGGKQAVTAVVTQLTTDFPISGSSEGRITADITAGNWRGVLEFELALAHK